MKLRYSGYLVAAAVLAIALVSCGKKEDTSEQPAATASTQPAGQPVDAATAGTITGTIKLDGTPPAPGKISMAADAYCASQHPNPVATEDRCRRTGWNAGQCRCLHLRRHEQVRRDDSQHARDD